MMRRVITGAVGSLLVAGLGACSGQSLGSPVGVVKGFISPCSGPPVGAPPFEHVRVLAVRHGEVIAAQTGHKLDYGYGYRLVLEPGRYLIREANASQAVVVHSGQTTTANFPNQCD
jgi:hypothetical protein